MFQTTNQYGNIEVLNKDNSKKRHGTKKQLYGSHIIPLKYTRRCTVFRTCHLGSFFTATFFISPNPEPSGHRWEIHIFHEKFLQNHLTTRGVPPVWSSQGWLVSLREKWNRNIHEIPIWLMGKSEWFPVKMFPFLSAHWSSSRKEDDYDYFFNNMSCLIVTTGELSISCG